MRQQQGSWWHPRLLYLQLTCSYAPLPLLLALLCLLCLQALGALCDLQALQLLCFSRLLCSPPPGKGLLPCDPAWQALAAMCSLHAAAQDFGDRCLHEGLHA